MTHVVIAESTDLPSSVIFSILAVDVPILLLTGRKYPQIPLMMIFALAPFQHDMSIGGPVHFSIAEINLILTCILFAMRKRPICWGPAAKPIALYLGIGLLSSVFNWHSSTLSSMIQMVLYLCAAVVVFTSYGRNEEDFRPALYGLLGVGLILALAVIIKRTGYVLGLHKNGVGDSLAAAVIVCGELWFAAKPGKQRHILTGVMVILSAGLFFSLSRGAWMGAVIGLVMILIMRRQFGIMLRAGIFMVPLIVLCWRLLPDQDRTYASGVSKENWNIRMRYNSMYIAQACFEENELLGIGVGLRKDYDATNVFWLTLAETGVLGCAAFLALNYTFVRMVWRTQKRLARTDPLYSVVAIGGALVTSKFVHGMVDHYWSRGAIMIVWSSAGMATYGYYVVRQRAQIARARAVSPLAAMGAPAYAT